MIRDNEIAPIGATLKPHGINGELSATIDCDVDIDGLSCVIFDIDGIFVPFFIKSYRSRGAEAVLLTIDGIGSEIEAAGLANHEIYALKSDLPDETDTTDNEGIYLSDLIGFNVTMSDGERTVGVIEDFDDTTENTLIKVIDANDKAYLLPFAEELIAGIDMAGKSINLDLPEGLLEL